MKRIITLTFVIVCLLLTSVGCSSDEDNTITIGASPVPHAEILEVAKEVLAEEGYALEIQEFTEYVQQNMALDSGDIDANFFQHVLFLEDFNQQNDADLIAVAKIHYEPIGLYPGKAESITDLEDGSTIAVPNDTTNEARALLLLEQAGLIKVDPDAGLSATINDITENPKNLVIEEIDAAQVSRTLSDVDMAVINGNYALLAELNVETDALIKEEKESLSATTYVNVLAVREGDEEREDIQALVKALQSEEVKQFIDENYKGSVVPMF